MEIVTLKSQDELIKHREEVSIKILHMCCEWMEQNDIPLNRDVIINSLAWTLIRAAFESQIPKEEIKNTVEMYISDIYENGLR